MFTIAVRYLCGRVTAAEHHDYGTVEWPPHPDRLFMALVATHKETNPDDDRERQALLWLEAQPAPRLSTPPASPRAVRTHFVPTNDAATSSVKKDKAVLNEHLAALPEFRTKQPRSFPSAVPDREMVQFTWNHDPTEACLEALKRLCLRVSRIGHSSSLVAASVMSEPSPPNLEPGNGRNAIRLRVPSPGRLAALEHRYTIALRPEPGVEKSYVPIDGAVLLREPAATVFDPNMLVFRCVGRQRFGLESTLMLTDALRRTVLAFLGDHAIPEWISGHRTDGLPSEQPHMALVPLANVAHRHGDGTVMGLAMVLPRSIATCDRGAVFNAFCIDFANGGIRRHRLTLGRAGACELVLDDGEKCPWNLQPKVWCAVSSTWATVTPIVLDRYRKRADGPGFEAGIIATAVERIGLPRPVAVDIRPTSPHVGAPSGSLYPCLVRRGGEKRQHVHAVLQFAEPVKGPLLLGAGRYCGYGLLRPFIAREEACDGH